MCGSVYFFAARYATLGRKFRWSIKNAVRVNLSRIRCCYLTFDGRFCPKRVNFCQNP